MPDTQPSSSTSAEPVAEAQAEKPPVPESDYFDHAAVGAVSDALQAITAAAALKTAGSNEAVPELSPTPAAAAVAAKPYPWIVHPVVDILFCCGVFPLILYGLILLGIPNDPFAGPGGFGMWALTIIAVHLFQDAHGVASWHRILTHKETMNSIKPYFITITAIAAIAFVPLLLNLKLLLNCYRLYFLFGAYHWLMQSYGVSLVYCYKRGYILNNKERRLFLLVYQSICAFAIIRVLALPEFGQFNVYGYDISFPTLAPAWILSAVQVFMEVVIAAFAGVVIKKYMQTKAVFPLPAFVLLCTTVWVFSLAAPTYFLLGFFIGAFYHGSQSWCVTTSVHCKIDGLPPGITFNTIWKMFFKRSTWMYLGLLFIVSELIFTVIPRLVAYCGPSLGVAFATTVCIFSTHHFLCDSAIWKLKDPKVRALLIN